MQRWLKIVLMTLSALLVPSGVRAAYNSNIQGVIASVRVYDTGRVLIRLEIQPSAHPVCNPNYFAIPSTLDTEIRAMLLSRALVAKASGETINLGYDNLDECAHGYIRIHTIG